MLPFLAFLRIGRLSLLYYVYSVTSTFVLPFTVVLRPGRSLHDQVVFAVTKAVISGQLQSGDRFPPVRVLSQELRINPNTAQKIVSTLVERGLLEARPGIGTTVAAWRPPPRLDDGRR